MSHTINVDFTNHIVWIQGFDEVGRAGYTAGFDELLETPGVDRSFALHLDLRGVTSVMSVQDARILSEHFRRPPWMGRIAFLVTRPVHYGLGRVACGVLQPWGIQIGVFREQARAARWVTGVDELKDSWPAVVAQVGRWERG